MATKLASLGKIRQLQDRVMLRPDVLPFHHIGFTLSLCRKWPDGISAIIDEPTWRHYSLLLISPLGYVRGAKRYWYKQPMRFGLYRTATRSYLYLGIITFGWDHSCIDRHPSRRIEDYTRHLGMVDLVWGA